MSELCASTFIISSLPHFSTSTHSLYLITHNWDFTSTKYLMFLQCNTESSKESVISKSTQRKQGFGKQNKTNKQKDVSPANRTKETTKTAAWWWASWDVMAQTDASILDILTVFREDFVSSQKVELIVHGRTICCRPLLAAGPLPSVGLQQEPSRTHCSSPTWFSLLLFGWIKWFSVHPEKESVQLP